MYRRVAVESNELTEDVDGGDASEVVDVHGVDVDQNIPDLPQHTTQGEYVSTVNHVCPVWVQDRYDQSRRTVVV